jgi:RND family efflux transporter MFP subunit
MKKLNTLLVISALSMLLSSCGGGHEAHSTDAGPAVPVAVATASATSVDKMVAASGTIGARSSANVSTRMMGNVSALNVKVGDKVKKGQSLITLYNTDLLAKRSQVEARINQAKSALENAEKDFQRFKALYEKGSASEKELDDMTTRFEMAQAQLEAAQNMKQEVEAQFAYTNIKAPFSGVVANTFVKVGDMANPGMPLVAVEGTTGYEAQVFVSESDIQKIQEGSDARVIIKSLQKTLVGKVTEVSLSAKNTGGQYLVTIDLGEQTEGILPGMFVNAQFTVAAEGSSRATLMVPQKAIVSRGQLTGVYTVAEDRKALLRWLRLGRPQGDQVEVLSGLQAGEQYIVSAEGRLYNGVQVTF